MLGNKMLTSAKHVMQLLLRDYRWNLHRVGFICHDSILPWWQLGVWQDPFSSAKGLACKYAGRWGPNILLPSLSHTAWAIFGAALMWAWPVTCSMSRTHKAIICCATVSHSSLAPF